MDHIDQSLEDIIAASKQKKLNNDATKKAKVKPGARPGPHTRPARTKRNEALFTETYKALMAPVKEIFTSRYIPRTGPIKLIAINNNAIQARSGAAQPNSSRPIRLVATRKTSTDTYSPASQANIRSNTTSRAVYRAGDYYRPSPRSGSSYRDRNVSSPARSGIDSKARSGRLDDTQSSKGVTSVRNEGRSPSPYQKVKEEPEESSWTIKKSQHVPEDMDIESEPLSIKGEGGPVTVEIENLDYGTSAEDVKVVCSRFGEIKSCTCANGFAQVTYARKAAGLAAVETLNGKKADNNQILRVTMRKSAVIHNTPMAVATHVPSAIAGPMKLLTKAVEGTIKNAGTLYQEQLQAAQQMLKVQQQRMAQLHLEEQRIAALRMQANLQFDDVNGGPLS